MFPKRVKAVDMEGLNDGKYINLKIGNELYELNVDDAKLLRELISRTLVNSTKKWISAIFIRGGDVQFTDHVGDAHSRELKEQGDLFKDHPVPKDKE